MITLSLGSNLGNRLAHLQQAIALLKARYLTHCTESIVLETNSILPPGAPSDWDKPYLNMIVRGECALTPHALIKGIQAIEQEMGRPADHARWSPRIIDIDILLWDGLTLDMPGLTIPHPEIENRDFLIHLLSSAQKSKTHSNHIIKEKLFINSLCASPKLVGIVNVTPNSFSDGGLYQGAEQAIAKVLTLADEGATIIELGAQATSPGAAIQNSDAEYALLSPVLDGLLPKMRTGELAISIDTFWPETIKRVLENYPISWINDVKGSLDDETLKNIAKQGCTFVAMHSVTIPADKRVFIPTDIPAIDTLLDWGTQTRDRLLALGFNQTQIILDPGIGFGKSPFQDLDILREIEQFHSLGCQLLVGHSRKFFMKTFTTNAPQDRDLETIAISDFLKDKVDYLRVHNVKDHQRFFVAKQNL